MPPSDLERIDTEDDKVFRQLDPWGWQSEQDRLASTLLPQFKRALDIAWFNNYQPVRFVLSRRMSRKVGSPIKTIYGIPVQVDEDTDEGFGLVVSR